MLTVRNLKRSDIGSAMKLQQAVYKYIPCMTQPQFEDLLKRFPQGQFVAESKGKIVGFTISLVILWDDYSLQHTWASITNNGNFDTHNIELGRTLYGAEVCVSPEVRGLGVGRKLYEARRKLCRLMNLKRIIAGGRLPGYKDHAKLMSPEDYAKRVIWGDLYDPVLRFQLNQDFDFCGILDNYIPSDIESHGFASLIVWLNKNYDASLPTKILD